MDPAPGAKPNVDPHREEYEKAAVKPSGGRDTAFAGGGTGAGTGGRYDEKRDHAYPESAPPYAGDHAAMDFDASRHGADASVPVTNTGVDNAAVDEFTTGGNSLGQNAGVSRDNPPSVSQSHHDSGRRPGERT